MHLYAPSNHVQNLRNEVIHTYIQTIILSGCKKEICICIKIQVCFRVFKPRDQNAWKNSACVLVKLLHYNFTRTQADFFTHFGLVAASISNYFYLNYLTVLVYFIEYISIQRYQVDIKIRGTAEISNFCSSSNLYITLISLYSPFFIYYRTLYIFNIVTLLRHVLL
jgi:hypothetical protein